MSARLLKSLADGRCTVRNAQNGECIIYVTSDDGTPQNLVVRHNAEIDLTQHFSIRQLRKSPNLKALVNSGSLIVV